MKAQTEPWYKRLLCGYNLLGDTADLLCRGTEIDYELDEQDINSGSLKIRCWCCTFWRGVIFGGVIGFSVGLIVKFYL